MKYCQFLLLSLLLPIFAHAQHASRKDTIANILDHKAQAWLRYIHIPAPVVKKDLREGNTAVINYTPCDTAEANLVPAFLRSYAPGQSYFADIYSGTYAIEKVAGKWEVAGEPESAIKISRKNELFRVYQAGYAVVFDEVYWLNGHTFIVTGYHIGTGDEITPAVWYYDLPNASYTEYTFPTRKKSTLADVWVKQKLKAQ